MWTPDHAEFEKREYIGDGVYASFDGYQIWLRTERGTLDRPDVHVIALEPAVFDRLMSYYRKVYETKEKQDDAGTSPRVHDVADGNESGR